jgi:hypothetical protein
LTEFNTPTGLGWDRAVTCETNVGLREKAEERNTSGSSCNSRYSRRSWRQLLVVGALQQAQAAVSSGFTLQHDLPTLTCLHCRWSSLQLERVRRKARCGEVKGCACEAKQNGSAFPAPAMLSCSQVELKELLKVTDPGWSSEGLTSGDPAAVQQALAQVAARASTGQLLGMSDAAPRQFEARSCSSPGEHSSRHTQNGTVQGSDGHGPQGLDSSMDSHFGYIQEVSTAEELEQLMGQLKATLYEVRGDSGSISHLQCTCTCISVCVLATTCSGTLSQNVHAAVYGHLIRTGNRCDTPAQHAASRSHSCRQAAPASACKLFKGCGHRMATALR